MVLSKKIRMLFLTTHCELVEEFVWLRKKCDCELVKR